MMTKEKPNRLTPFLIGLVCLLAGVLYILTLAPSLDKIDSGELATVQITGGVAHPTGYPLFTIIGFLFSKIPFPGSSIYQMNFLAMLFVIAGIFLFAKSVLFFTTQFKSRVQTGNVEKGFIEKHGNLIACLIGAVFLALSRTVWEQALSVEVYSLQILLICGTIFTFLKAYFQPVSNVKSWMVAAALLALSFTNHLSTLVLLPAIAWLFFQKFGFNKNAFRTIGLMLLVFVPILVILYSWLPLRAHSEVHTVWGNPGDWDLFKYHVTGRQFSVWLFTGMKAFQSNLKEFITGLPMEFVITGFLLALPGIWYSLKSDKKTGVFFLLIFLGDILYVSNYNIHDLEPYYLPALIVVGYWIVIGLRYFIVRSTLSPMLKATVVVISLSGTGVEAGYNYIQNDKHDLYMFEDYTRDALGSLPQDAILITFQWDFLVSPSYYLQQVEKFRPDIHIIDYEILRNRIWYVNHMERNMPELVTALQPELAAFEKALEPFFYEKKFNPNYLSQTFSNTFTKLIKGAGTNRPVYLAPEMIKGKMQEHGLAIPPGYSLIPEKYFFRLQKETVGNNYTPYQMTAAKIRMPDYQLDESYYVRRIRENLAILCQDRAMYELKNGQNVTAKELAQKAKFYYPDVQIYPELRGAF